MADIFYHAVPTDWRREQKYRFLEVKESIANVEWQRLEPDAKNTWLTSGLHVDFGSFLPLGNKETKKSAKPEAIFCTYSRGVCSNSDAYVYAFSREALEERAKRMVETYAGELDRWRRAGAPDDLEKFLQVNEADLKWIRRTKKELARGKEVAFQPVKIRQAQYRPFARLAYYFEDTFNEDTYQFGEFFPNPEAESENRVIAVTDAGF